MTSDILTVTSSDGPGVSTVIAVTGEIDRDSRERLRQAADEATGRGRRHLVVDLGAVTFCDSSGLSLFVDLHRRALRQDGWLRLAAVPPHVRKIMKITELERLFAVYDTVGAATVEP